jgi:hypothetical protein
MRPSTYELRETGSEKSSFSFFTCHFSASIFTEGVKGGGDARPESPAPRGGRLAEKWQVKNGRAYFCAELFCPVHPRNARNLWLRPSRFLGLFAAIYSRSSS